MPPVNQNLEQIARDQIDTHQVEAGQHAQIRKGFDWPASLVCLENLADSATDLVDLSEPDELIEEIIENLEAETKGDPLALAGLGKVLLP